MGAEKLEKCEGGCVGFRDPNFLNYKNHGVWCRKPFANWLGVSGWKSNVSDWYLKTIGLNDSVDQVFSEIWIYCWI